MKNTNYIARKETEQNMPSSTQIDSRLSPQKHLPTLVSIADSKVTENDAINNKNGLNDHENKHVNTVVPHQQGFLERCATIFVDGNYKQLHSNQENSGSSINPKQVKQTFAQEIEEKYFQVPSSSNVQEVKHSRRGSLRAFQNVANAILERRGSNSGVVSSSAPTRHTTRQQSPAKSKQKRSNMIEGKVEIRNDNVEPLSLNFSNVEKSSPFCTPPQSPPPRPRPRTRNTSLKQSKGKNIPQASPLLQKRPPATPPSSPVVLTRRSHTPIRLNGSSATRRSSTPTCSVQAPLTPNIARSTSRDQTLDEISPECVVRDYLAPLLSPALTLATHSVSATGVIPPTSAIRNEHSHEQNENFKEATGFSPKIRSKRSRTHGKRSPFQDSINTPVDSQHNPLNPTKPLMLTTDTSHIQSTKEMPIEHISDNSELSIYNYFNKKGNEKQEDETSLKLTANSLDASVNKDIDQKNQDVSETSDLMDARLGNPNIENSTPIKNIEPQEMTQKNFEEEYDVIKKIGEGWFSRVYLTEHRKTRQEVALKAVAIDERNENTFIGAQESFAGADDEDYLYINEQVKSEFLREYKNSCSLSSHANILSVYDILFQLTTTATAPQATKADTTGSCRHGYHPRTYCMFAMEYAPFGDLTSMVGEPASGIGEACAKRVARQIGSALDWIHGKNMCHLDVRLDNILVFKSDFSLVKLCDFGSVRTQGDIVIKKNELLPYCPAELVAKHANEYYQVDRCQDVFQFGIVVFFCLFGRLPWQRADIVSDPNFSEFCNWLDHHKWRRTTVSGAMAGMAAGAGMGGAKVPKNFKLMTTKAQKLFRKLLDADPSRRMKLGELPKFTEEKWLRSRSNRGSLGMIAAAVAQAVVGNNGTPQEVAGTTLTGSNNPMHQNPAVPNYLNERRCSGPEARSTTSPDNKTVNISNEVDFTTNCTSPGSQSESTSNVHNNPKSPILIKNGYNDHPSTSRFISDGISQLTMGSFQSVHSNAIEKNRVLYTLLQHGVETTVDRSQKNSRILNWIKYGQSDDKCLDEHDFIQPDIEHSFVNNNSAQNEKHFNNSNIDSPHRKSTENVVPSNIAAKLNLPASPKTSNGRNCKQPNMISNQQEKEEISVRNGRRETRHHNKTNGLNNITSSSNDTTVQQHKNQL